MRPNMSKMRFFFCPCFLEDFIKLFFGRCRSGTCRKHYKNGGFGAWVVKAKKMRFCAKTFVCFDKARDFVTHSRLFLLRAVICAFVSCASNTYFYSGFRASHRGGYWWCAWNHYKNRGLRHISRDGEIGRTQKGGKSRMKTCFGALCLKPLFL